MAERSFPFDTDPNTGQPQEVFEEDFSELLKQTVSDGAYQTGLGYTEDVPSAEITVHSGRAVVHGYGYYNTADLVHSVPANTDPSFKRTDRIFLRLDKASNEVVQIYVQGTPGSDISWVWGDHPAPPAPTRTASVWDAIFLRVVVDINSNDFVVYDERSFTLPAPQSHATQTNFDTYDQHDGQIAFMWEGGQNNGTPPRWMGRHPIIETESSQSLDILHSGPHRLFHLDSDQTLGTFSALAGWENDSNANSAEYNSVIEYKGGGVFEVHQSGWYEFDWNIEVVNMTSTGEIAQFRVELTDSTVGNGTPLIHDYTFAVSGGTQTCVPISGRKLIWLGKNTEFRTAKQGDSGDFRSFHSRTWFQIFLRWGRQFWQLETA